MIHDIALAHGHDPALAGLRSWQQSGLEAIAACGTVAAGVHQEVCDHCGDTRSIPNTCGHRCCPHCQARERAAWVEARTAELLPCGYFHAVFTLPPELRAAAEVFPVVVLGALMRAAGDVIDLLGRDPRFLGAEVGQLAVLHTWTRILGWHPHVHIIVTAGGWDAQHQRWIDARTYGRQRRPFLAPISVLRAAYQRRLRRLLLRAQLNGDFADGAGLPELASAEALKRHLTLAMLRPWVIRVEPPFGGPQRLLKYLGAYVNRTAVSPGRVAFEPDSSTVTLAWKANADPHQPRQITMSAVDFLRAFARHILPPRFQRIRFRGLWSTAHRATKLHVAQAALAQRRPPGEPPPPPPPEPRRDRCTICGHGYYQRLPGPCPRPAPRVRRRLLALIRAGWIDPTHGEAPATA